MDTIGEGENGASFNKEMESWHQLRGEEDPSQFLGQTSGLLEADLLQGITLNFEGQTAVMGDLSLQPTADRFESLQLELQDSCLSPALTLIPQEKAFLPSESTLLHQTDCEFFPLRGSPDLSIASERCLQMSRPDVDRELNLTHRTHQQASLSQHHLGTMSAILEDASSYCSLSQHSLSPESNYQSTQIHDEEHSSDLKNKDCQKEEKSDNDLDEGITACVSNGGISVHSFQNLMEKDLSVASSSVLSSCVAVLNQTDAVKLHSTNNPENQSRDSATSTKDPQLRPSEGREQPQGSSSSLLPQKRTLSAPLSDLSLKQLQLHSESSLAALESKNLTKNKNTPVFSSLPPGTEGGVFTAGLQRALGSSGIDQTADGSFLTPRPVYQSTPAVHPGRGAPPAANRFPVYSHQKTVAASTQNSSPVRDDIPDLTLSATSHQSDAEVTIDSSMNPDKAPTESRLQHEIPHGQEAPSPLIDVPVISEDAPLVQSTLDTFLPTSEQRLKDGLKPRLSKGSVHSLPSLNYVQKVDAWTANQTSSRCFSDNLSFQGDRGVPPKNKEQHFVSEALKQQHSNKTSSLSSTNHNTQTGSGLLEPMELAEGAVGSTSPSPVTHSYSHSSLGTVITPIQSEELQQTQPSLAHKNGFPPGSTEVESLLSINATTNQGSDKDLVTGTLKPPAFQNVDQYNGINTNITGNMLSSLQASIGAASSVVSLELDNYAPYWTSRPGSPRRPPEFNIEDRIPLYLHNLGIDQSPSTILNPFTHRGPVREPEFSPTDLCTIKGSTPTKSIQPSDGDSLQKEAFSSSSVLSANSSASVTQLVIQNATQQLARPTSSDSIKIADFQTTSSPELHSLSDDVSQMADISSQEGGYGLSTKVSFKDAPVPETWESGDSSLVGSGTLHEIRRLLGPAHDSIASFHSESNASFLSLQQNTKAHNEDSFLSVDGKISLLLACSSSDSALKESSTFSSGLLDLSTNSNVLSKGPLAPSLGRKENNPKSSDFRVAPRRAEPEGCSAADPDKVGPASLSVTQGNSAITPDDQQEKQDQPKNAGVSLLRISPTNSQTEAEMCVSSDASSEHSLASKVAKLLQSESTASVVTSRSSTAEPDESRAREWIMMKVSGAKCEALDLNAEDRRRIEEIKRELLLHTKYTKSSSDSESSAKSNLGTGAQPAVGFAAVRSTEDRLSEQLQRVSQIPLDSSASLHKPQTDRVSQAGIKGQSNPQTVSQCLHKHNSHVSNTDIAVEGNSYTTLRSSEDWKPHAQMTNRATKNEERKERVGKKREMGAEAVHLDSEKSILLPLQEAAHSIIREKREFPPGLESGSVLGKKTHGHFKSLVKIDQNTDHRLHSRNSDSCSYPEQPSGSHTHQSDTSTLNTSIRVLLPVSSTNKQQEAYVSTEPNLSKDINADQVQNRVDGFSQMTSRYPQAITSSQQPVGPSRPSSFNTAAIPTLLPYKPHGSSELFYMPKTIPELSPNCSDTTIESSHTGSDDAVPPKFTPEVLGSRELLDNHITPKHKEGIYSKRAKMKRESTLTGNCFYDQKVNTGLPSQHRQSALFENQQVAEQIKEGEALIPLHIEADYSTTKHPGNHRRQKDYREGETLPLHTKATMEKRQEKKIQDIRAEIGSSLDQLWHRFNERCNAQESRTINEVEISLLERLERLSRLLQSTSPPHTPKLAPSQVEKGKSRRPECELRRMQGTDQIEKETNKERGAVRGILKTAWEKESLSSKQLLLQNEKHKRAYRCPAERDQSASLSLETSSSESTIDTQRLIKAFGPHRVSNGRVDVAESQPPGLNDGLLKLHKTIQKQKQGHGNEDSEIHLVSVATETSDTDDSMVSDTLSSTSTYTLPYRRGTGRTTSSKRAKIKLVSRSIQAGDLEIVINGTRKDTRDVGTTFPSPGSSKVNRASTSVCSQENAGMFTLSASHAAPVQNQSVLRKQTTNKHTCYSNGLSWFVSADELKWDARKENNPQTDAGQSERQAWFEPYTRTQPWREPLRERHLQVDIQKPQQKTHSETNYGSKPSAIDCLSLQEALELHRPKFVSRSRERMKRLCLLVEERKIQAVFNKEREKLFNPPTSVQQPKAAPAPPPLPPKRVIPVNEMIQRSKRIYAKLPEVQRRKEEEKRKAAYHTYRLNAQLFNKKITNRVLGKRAPWQ